MTQLFRTAIALVAALGLALGFGAPAHANDNVTLIVTELPGQVRLIPGESIQLTLQTNRTTGYTWFATKSGKKKAIKVSKGTYIAPVTDLVGAPGETTWTVTAREPGTATVMINATPPGGENAEGGELTVIVMPPK